MGSEKKGKGADTKPVASKKVPAKVPPKPSAAAKSSPNAKAKAPAKPAAGKPAAPAAAGGKAAPGKPGEPAGAPKRKLGIKGAAPWAARHAAKHAAEARARAAEPAPPGSARATIRTPTGANEIKERLNELLRLANQLKVLRKNLARNFFEMGLLLREVQTKKLYEPRGYTTFEAFVERETDLGKELGGRLARIPVVFTREAATELGLDKLLAGLGSMEPARESESAMPAPVRPSSTVRMPEPSGRAF